MSYKIIDPSTTLPVTLEDIKGHLRLIDDNEDSYLLSLLESVIDYAQKIQKRLFCECNISIFLDYFPEGEFSIIPSPVNIVDDINYIDKDNNTYILDKNNYLIDYNSDPARLVILKRPSIQLKIIGGIEIKCNAGYKDNKIPLSTKRALLLLIGHYYELREASSNLNFKEIPFGVKTLLDIERIRNY